MKQHHVGAATDSGADDRRLVHHPLSGQSRSAVPQRRGPRSRGPQPPSRLVHDDDRAGGVLGALGAGRAEQQAEEAAAAAGAGDQDVLRPSQRREDRARLPGADLGLHVQVPGAGVGGRPQQRPPLGALEMAQVEVGPPASSGSCTWTGTRPPDLRGGQPCASSGRPCTGCGSIGTAAELVETPSVGVVPQEGCHCAGEFPRSRQKRLPSRICSLLPPLQRVRGRRFSILHYAPV